MRNILSRKALLILSLSFLWLTVCRADERFWIDATVDSRRVRLQFDSGSDRLFLHRPTAERLGFKVSSAKTPNGKSYYWAKEKCTLSFGDYSASTRFVILEYPSFVPPDDGDDGLLGWRHMNDRIILFDALQQKLEFLREVPKEALTWTKLRLSTKLPILALEVPSANGTKGIIVVDSGSDTGLGLSARNWNHWKAAHPTQPTTFTSGYNAKAGLMVRAQAWADELSLGPLRLTSVIVEEADPLTAGKAGTKHAATWGMAALKRLDFIVDGKQRVAYLRPKTTPPLPQQHNRLGAAFVPRNAQSDDIILQVADGSPAFDAGIRTGDLLLKIDGKAATKTEPLPENATSIYDPAGTKLRLTLKRGGEELSVTPVLRDILAPNTASPPATPK